jgi:hypothetical protein
MNPVLMDALPRQKHDRDDVAWFRNDDGTWLRSQCQSQGIYFAYGEHVLEEQTQHKKTKRENRYPSTPSPVLGETDGSRLLTEALTAEIQTVLADKTSLVGTETALTTPFSVFSGAREPNGVVGHGEGLGCLRRRVTLK